jgi:oligogalacturonide lyase
MTSARSWVEPLTGHRVTRLSEEPGTRSLYFHQNAFPLGGDVVVVRTPQNGLCAIELATHRARALHAAPASSPVVAPGARQVFHLAPDAVLATDVDSTRTRLVARLPRGWRIYARDDDECLLSASADGRLLAGVAMTDPEAPDPPADLRERWARHLPYVLFVVDAPSGSVQAVHEARHWLNHPQVSPSDPRQILYCHEGPWHLVDRIWTLRVGEREPRLVHARQAVGDIAGHEVWSRDGRVIWYDLQTPQREVFWLAGHELATGEVKRLRLRPDAWSLHMNPLPDGRFVCDGGGRRSVAGRRHGAWVSLFLPRRGALEVRRLVDLGRHDYRLEPNPQPTPDMRRAVFRAALSGGPAHVYAVDLAPCRRRPWFVPELAQRLRSAVASMRWSPWRIRSTR